MSTQLPEQTFDQSAKSGVTERRGIAEPRRKIVRCVSGKHRYDVRGRIDAPRNHGPDVVMAESQNPKRQRIVISQDRGRTWREMPTNFRQDGRIIMTNTEFVVQHSGRHETWYALADDPVDDT